MLPNPVGYNRVYVQIEEDFTWKRWWDGLRAGRSFVTNGPLLRCRANGELPGAVLQTDGSQLAVEVDMSLISSDPVSRVEVIYNGEIVTTIEPTDELEQSLSASLTVDESGWLLVRALTGRTETFRFASTAPWHVEVGEGPRHVSRRSAEFFAEWAADRAERVRRSLTDPDEIRDVLPAHEEAVRFWRERAARANAD